MPRLPPSDPALPDGARSLEPLRGAFREATGGRWELSSVLRRGDGVLLSLVDPEVGELVLELGWKTYASSSFCSSGGVGVSYRGKLDASQRTRLNDALAEGRRRSARAARGRWPAWLSVQRRRS